MATAQWRKENADKLRAYRRDWYARNSAHAKAKVVARKRALVAWLHEYKAARQCEHCSEDHVACLEFHHIDSGSKDFAICDGVVRGLSRARLLKEIAKCKLLCANCHKKWHWEHDRSV